MAQNYAEWQEMDALSLEKGQQFRVTEKDEDWDLIGDETFTAANIIREVICSEECIYVETPGSKSFSFGEGDRLLIKKQENRSEPS